MTAEPTRPPRRPYCTTEARRAPFCEQRRPISAFPMGQQDTQADADRVEGGGPNWLRKRCAKRRCSNASTQLSYPACTHKDGWTFRVQRMYNTHTAPPSSRVEEFSTPIIPHLAEGAVCLELIPVSWCVSAELIPPTVTYCGDPRGWRTMSAPARKKAGESLVVGGVLPALPGPPLRPVLHTAGQGATGAQSLSWRRIRRPMASNASTATEAAGLSEKASAKNVQIIESRYAPSASCVRRRSVASCV